MKSKHLSMNIPENFDAHIEFAKEEILGSLRSKPMHRRFANRYHSAALVLDESIGEQRVADLAEQLLDIEARYYALFRTVDKGVELRELYHSYDRLAKLLARNANQIRGSNSSNLTVSPAEDYILKTSGWHSMQNVPSSLDAFGSARSLAEKTLIAKSIILKMSEEVHSISEHFNYKSDLRTRGGIPRYSFVYLISALAGFFEDNHPENNAASVNNNEIPVSVDHGQEDFFRETGSVRYTGQFVDFADAFMQSTSASHIRQDRGAALWETARKLLQKLKAKPKLYLLLHQSPVEVEHMLEFMSLADDIKP